MVKHLLDIMAALNYLLCLFEMMQGLGILILPIVSLMFAVLGFSPGAL